MVTVPERAFNDILKRQKRVDVALAKLQETVESMRHDEEYEIRPNVIARWERQSKLMDQGKGIHFKNMKEYRAYVRSL